MSSTKVGELAKTAEPLPVLSVRADARLALEGVPKKTETPEPNPLTPELIGRPVAFVSVTEAGVPRLGVTRVGLVAKTRDPEPVSSDITPLNSDDVVAEKSLNLFAPVVNVPLVGSVIFVEPVDVSVML